MKTEVESEQATVEEAIAILLEHMPASKVARVLAFWQAGSGDYLRVRETLFREETVDSLYEKAVQKQNSLSGSPH